MICFRDQMFCAADCSNTVCLRNLTTELKAEARTWWGGPGAPIAMADLSARCPDYAPIEDTCT